MHRIKLLKAWAHDGKTFAAGETLEINDADVVKTLLFDGLAVKDNSPEIKSVDDLTKAIGPMVSEAVKNAVANPDLQKGIAAQAHAITIKDMKEDDPTWGYLAPHADGRAHSREEKMFGIGVFATDVKNAGEQMAGANDRLKFAVGKAREQKQKAAQYLEKAAGTGMQVGTESDIGAAIPPEFSTMLLQEQAILSTIEPLCSTINLTSNSIDLPKVKDYDRSSSLVYGGVVAYWKAEDAAFTESKPKMETVSLKLNALTALAYASHEAVTFSPFDLAGYLVPKMNGAIVFKKEDAFINGVGAGMPVGILNAASKIAITAESGQTASAKVIVTENIDKMEERLYTSMGGANVRFMGNRSSLHRWLRSLSRSVGTGGELAKIYQFQGFGNGQAAIDGVPLLFSEHMPAAATAGDLTLVDWSRYLVANHRSGIELASSIHLKFDYGQTAYRMVVYCDAKPMDTTVFQMHKGQTMAPVMTIATRT